jgi:hypothetical protein
VIGVAHQLAQILQLAPARLALGDGAGGLERGAQRRFERNARELGGGQFEQRGGELLQLLIFALARRFARALRGGIGVEIVAHEAPP